MVYNKSKRSSDSSGFSNYVDDAMKRVQSAIISHKDGTEKFSNEKQLEKILKELKKMKDVINSDDFKPAFPRIIVDSWDYNNNLGIELLELHEIYKRVK